MQWSCGKNGGFSDHSPWMDLADNYWEIHVEKQREEPDSVFSFYKALIQMRKEMEVISKGTIEFMEKENPDVLAYERKDKNKVVMVFGNLTEHKTTVWEKKPWETFQKVLGNYEGLHREEGQVILRPYEVVVLESM